MKNWLGIIVKIFHYNNKRSAGNDVEALIEAKGCTIEYSAPGLLEINGPAERSRGIIVRTARALLNDIDLPRNL
jgi:transposase InsO family protein